ncbi:hypothetical protein [Streptomyces sp. NPDC012510]|uniref:hypothetical protein n=1 Tax=Streptomyces sp. NPDC012510 TaxID=3364838 RepID=UPI0036ED3948
MIDTLVLPGVFRVDHALGLPTAWNLFALRLANRVLEAVWNSRHIEQIDILWEEDLGLEGRAGYFDRSGTLRDVMQNHMLQILSRVAMGLPASRSASTALRTSPCT